MYAYVGAMHVCMHVYASAVQIYVQMLCICVWLHMHVCDEDAMQCNAMQCNAMHECNAMHDSAEPGDPRSCHPSSENRVI